jgi:hypothetical protein
MKLFASSCWRSWLKAREKAVFAETRPHGIVVNARAFAYGLAGMAAGGHFPEWQVTGDLWEAAEHALAYYAGMLTAAPGKIDDR